MTEEHLVLIEIHSLKNLETAGIFSRQIDINFLFYSKIHKTHIKLKFWCHKSLKKIMCENFNKTKQVSNFEIQSNFFY